jgi:hypothetical protein
MLCCAVGVAAVATGAIGWKRFRRFLWGRLNAQSALAAAAVAMIAVTTAGLGVEHFRHHAAYASDSDAALLIDPGAALLCRGRPPVDRITDIASTRE